MWTVFYTYSYDLKVFSDQIVHNMLKGIRNMVKGNFEYKETSWDLIAHDIYVSNFFVTNIMWWYTYTEVLVLTHPYHLPEYICRNDWAEIKTKLRTGTKTPTVTDIALLYCAWRYPESSHMLPYCTGCIMVKGVSSFRVCLMLIFNG